MGARTHPSRGRAQRLSAELRRPSIMEPARQARATSQRSWLLQTIARHVAAIYAEAELERGATGTACVQVRAAGDPPEVHQRSGRPQRGSSPKLQVLNTALLTALSGTHALPEAQVDRESRGRLTESGGGGTWTAKRRQVLPRSSTGAIATASWTSSCAGRMLVAIEARRGLPASRPGLDSLRRCLPAVARRHTLYVLSIETMVAIVLFSTRVRPTRRRRPRPCCVSS